MKASILIVDDEEEIRYIIKKFLMMEGYDVSTAINYNDALDKLSETDFDLVFTDIKLGIKSGIDVLREMKRRNMNCPVIMITGDPNIETATDAVRLGAYDYLFKPIRIETLTRITTLALRFRSVVEEKAKYQSNLEAIFRSVRDAIVTVDKELRIIEINDAAEEIFCFPDKREVKGKRCESFLNKYSEKYLEALAETINTKLPSERSRFESGNNKQIRRVVSVTTYPLIDFNEKLDGCVMVVRDETRLEYLEKNLNKRQRFHKIIGKSDKMQRIYSFIDALSDMQTTVLITGENGTGKGLVANALHYSKKDNKMPFVVVSCASLSDNLLESELFGHVKGAFTGAVSDRIGRFQIADGGTIFLDEIGDISNTMQLRLLRVLQEKEFERVGDSKPIKVNVRVIAATNQDIRKKVRYKKFREDLYHRLKVVELAIPPLRERREDIPLLIDHFIQMFNKRLNKNIKSVSADVQKIFMDYKWPGNIRELQHALEYAFVVCNKPFITVGNLPSEIGIKSTASSQSKEKKEHNEIGSIVNALNKTGWNKAKAARLLGMGRTTLYMKIKEYHITEN